MVLWENIEVNEEETRIHNTRKIAGFFCYALWYLDFRGSYTTMDNITGGSRGC